MTVHDLIDDAHEHLRRAGVTEPGSDVYLLLGKVLGKSRTQLLISCRDEVNCDQEDLFRSLLKRRCLREPVAYILGEQEFWSLPFHVDTNVLIPRPETEFLIEQVLAWRHRCSPPGGAILDLCCGSGAIAVVLALELRIPLYALDLSGAALEVARQNALRHNVSDQLCFIRSDLMTCLAPERRFSLIVTNPPYINSEVVQGQLDPEVAGYEPGLALDGGADGMDVIRRIRSEAAERLISGGGLFMEIGYDQGARVRDLFEQPVAGLPHFTQVKIVKDYAGRDRVLTAIIK